MVFPQANALERLRIIVLGYSVRWPIGGMAWHYLQYVLGLERLGHDVYFVEDSDNYVSCWDPSRGLMVTDPSYGLGFTSRAFRRAGISDRWAYYDEHQSCWRGPAADKIMDVCATADLVLNVSGVNPLRPWLMHAPARVLIDTDPGFTQIRHITEPDARKFALRHNRFVSFAENIGGPVATVPDDGLAWRRTRQPIVLDAWPVTPGPPLGEFRTVMQWDSYPPREYKGRRYGMKSDSFQAYAKLPQRTDAHLGLAATRLPPKMRDLLKSTGWSLHDAHRLSRDPWTYQTFLQDSKAELTVAKHGYVASRCGWFSERSACFLASGRPVIAQDTGFSSWMETGSGLLPFSTIEEALEAIEEVTSFYERHCRAARELAVEYFDSRKVLTQLIDRVMNPAAAPVNRSS